MADTMTAAELLTMIQASGARLAMLAERPGIRYAVVVANPDTDPVLVSVGIRDVATFELACPAANYDAFALLALIEQHGGTVH